MFCRASQLLYWSLSWRKTDRLFCCPRISDTLIYTRTVDSLERKSQTDGIRNYAQKGLQTLVSNKGRDVLFFQHYYCNSNNYYFNVISSERIPTGPLSASAMSGRCFLCGRIYSLRMGNYFYENTFGN